MVFHVLNRRIARMQVFEKAGDYEAFERVLKETLQKTPMWICAYCLMPNHWHFLLWPEHDGELDALRRSVQRGRPYGASDWQRQIAKRLAWNQRIVPPVGLESRKGATKSSTLNHKRMFIYLPISDLSRFLPADE